MAVQISGNDITVPRDGSFTRNVTIGETLTYEDVTNIDSVGLVTARNGIEIGARPGVAASISVDGNAEFAGIVTASSFVGSGANLTGVASTENIRTNTNATFLQNISVVGTSTVTGNIVPSSDSATDIGTNSGRFQNAYVDTYYGIGANLTGNSPRNLGATETQGYQNLKILTTANNSTVITCDSVLLENSSGTLIKVSSVNVTLDATGTGLNGLDTGTLTGGEFYHIYIINNGSTTGAVASLSSTSPTLPSGYTYKARVGGVASDNVSTDNLLLGQQINSSYMFAKVESDIVKVTNGSSSVTNQQFSVFNASPLASSWTAFIKTYGATTAGTTHRFRIGGTSGTSDGTYAQIWQMYHVTGNGIGDMNFQLPFVPIVELSSGVPQAYINTNSNTGPNWTVYCIGFKY